MMMMSKMAPPPIYMDWPPCRSSSDAPSGASARHPASILGRELAPF
jgi:hypothetical protein